MRTVLLIVGAFLELAGIVALVRPDLVPGARRLGAWLAPRWRPIESRLRRTLRLPPRVFEDAATVDIKIRISSSGVVDYDRDAPLEDRVAFLMRRNVDAQQETNQLAERVNAVEEGRTADLETLRSETAERIRASREENVVGRLLGGVALALGLFLTTVGNLL